MDKQYSLIDRVSKDSIKSPIFKKWLKRILCIACILSLALQLTLCCIPMQASALESIVGTWVFYDTIDIDSLYSINSSFYFQFTYANDVPGNGFVIQLYNGKTLYYYRGNYVTAYNDSWSSYNGVLLNTIDIISSSVTDGSGNDITAAFSSWLNLNATKVVEEVYDFTGETRIFNDELTLFNTSDATWSEAFAFNFEVLGVGSADYITLQRTAQNKYTMSYSFDFEDSGGLTMIYRDTPPFHNGEAEWLGGKVNRKVITFLSNPEDPEFQQWLLDNTTIFDNVNDAYQLGQQSGYNNGYEEGFANSLIGDSLSGPINALSQITLIEIQGTAITLGGVVMTAIALCLVLAFLKLYAGG